MDISKLTQKCQEALSEAQKSAITLGHQEVDAEHMLLALSTQDQGLFPNILQKMSIDSLAFPRL